MTEKQASKEETTKRRRSRPPALNTTNEARSLILAAALQAFAKNTFDGASIPDIARCAGVGGPLIHYHFGSKDNLWRETVDYAMRELAVPFEAIAASARDLEARDALKLLCRALANFASHLPEHVLILINEVRFPGERLDYVTDKYLRKIHSIIDGAIEKSIKDKSLKNIPTVHLTNIIINSITIFYSSGPLIELLYGVNPIDPDVSEAHSDWVVEVIFKGIEAHK